MIDITTPKLGTGILDAHPPVRQRAHNLVRSRPTMFTNSYLGSPRTPVRTPCMRQAHAHLPPFRGEWAPCTVRSADEFVASTTEAAT